jgi:hypothetical protein
MAHDWPRQVFRLSILQLVYPPGWTNALAGQGCAYQVRQDSIELLPRLVTNAEATREPTG